MTIKRIFFIVLMLTGFTVLSMANANASCSSGTVLVTVSTTNFNTGSAQITTVTFTATGNISTGTVLAVRIPDFWGSPFISGYSHDGNNTDLTYGVRYSTVGASFNASLTPATSSSYILFTVGDNAIVTGQSVVVYYAASTCQLGTALFRAYFQGPSCSSLNLVGSYSRTVVPGNPSFIGFEYYELIPQVNAVVPIQIESRDNCGNKVAVSGDVPVFLTALEDSGNAYATDFDVSLSTADPMVSTAPFKTISLLGGSSTTTVYYKITSFNAANYYSLRATYTLTSLENQSWLQVKPITTGISGLSVDTGLVGTSTSVAFTPDNNGVNDFAYINFSLPSSFNWEVGVSSDNFNSFTRRFYGYGNSGRITWDGNTDGTAGIAPGIAPAGTYRVRISVGAGGGALRNESLSIVLNVNGITGRVEESTSPVAIAGANVDVFGPTPRYAQTDSSGRFNVNGLQVGTYNVRINKAGYGVSEFTVTVPAGIVDVGTKTLERVSLLHLTVTRSTDVFLPEIWGGVNVRASDWSSQFYGSIHFVQGSTTSDAGDYYNGTLTTYTAISLLPNVVYNVELNIPGFNINPTTVSVAAGILNLTVPLQRRANIFGHVFLPAPATYGQWVSVEAGIDANMDGAFDSFTGTSRYYGGVFINTGASSGTYSVFGVNNGTYLLKAQVPGFARSSTYTVVSGGMDSLADFPVFGTGGVITGTITINGNTDVLDYDNDNDVDLYINAWSPTTFEGSNTQITVPTQPTLTIATYAITGLSNGSYEVGMWLNGFEASPPGPKFATVAGGNGTLNLTFSQFSGVLSGNVSLRGAATDFNNVIVEIRPLRNNSGTAGVVISSTKTPDGSGNYSFTGLGTDFYSVRARYATTGLVAEYGVQVVNGSTTTRNIDLTAQTYSISGRVTTAASTPYNDLSYLVNDTFSTSIHPLDGSSGVWWPANRIVAVRRNRNQQESNTQSGGMFTYTDTTITFYGTYNAATGTYTITGLSPGTYELFNNGEMDALTTNGPEISEEKRVVNIVSSNLSGQDFTLTDGFTVSGEMKIESGESETGRNFDIQLKNAKKETIVSESVFMNGTSVPFTLRRVPSGSYVLTARENSMTIKYSVKETPVDVAANVTGKELKLMKAAKIQGQLRVKNTGALISSNNYAQILPSNFYIEARSNPWFPGGYANANHPIIGTDGLFSMYVNPGTYDVIMKSQGFVGDSAISEGKKQFVPVTISGLEVVAGQTKDLGVIDLVEGIRIKGTVTDKNNNPLANIAVEARKGGQRNNEDALRAYTDIQGQYTIYGVDSELTRYYDIVAAPRPNTNDERYQYGATGIQYGEVRKAQVDTQTTTDINFKLEPAAGSVHGTVVTPDGGQLTLPFGDDDGAAGAYVIMNKQGNVPQNNPLGDIEVQSNANGDFLISGLGAGIYDLWVIANGYGSANIRNISVGSSQVELSTITLLSGYKLSGTLLKTDGTAPSTRDLDVLLGVRNGFEEILVGTLFEDASGNVSKYEISGFQSGKTYSVVLMYQDGDINVLSSSVTLTSNTEQNFTIKDTTPTAITQITRNADTGLLTVQFELSRSLRNSQIDLDENGFPDDSEQDKLITLHTGIGTLSFPESWLSSDRKRIIAHYQPAAGETSFKLRFRGTFISQRSDNGQNHSVDQIFTFFAGIGKQKTSRVSNANGGSVQLENDPSELSIPSGTFGDDPNLQVEVTMSAADTSDTLASQLDIKRFGVAAMSRYQTLGAKAYPTGMARAMGKLKAQSIDPFGSFYDIFLPAGVSHSFPSGKEANMCLSYDSTVSDVDAYSLNVYYFNESTDEYLLEDTNKSVDTENKRICVSLAHASIFTILNSSANIITGAGYTGPLQMINFPNPFNLKQKTVNLQDPGSATASQTIDGTMIKISAPAGIGGALKIEIFSVSGELVREINGSITAGTHSYVEWDGKNDEGQRVASGAYIARMTIDGENEKFLKLAVIK